MSGETQQGGGKAGQARIFTPHGFTSRTSQPEVALATSDVANGAVFLFQCGARRSLSHVHQGVLGLGQFGLGKVDEKKKAALKSMLVEEARWTVTGSAGGDAATQLNATKSHPAFGNLSVHIYFDKLLDESNGKAWTIMVRALERDLAPASAAVKKNAKKLVHVYTSPAKFPKAPLAPHWLVFDGHTTPSGEAGRLEAADPEARRDVEPYYSLACYVDVASLVAHSREGASSGAAPSGGAVQQLRLYSDGWLRDDLRRHLHLADLTQAVEQIAHSPKGDELFEEIHGRESLLSHLAHWDGFEKEAIFSQGHQCDHDHGDGEDHHHDHDHGHGHAHGQQPTRVPKQAELWRWLTGDASGKAGAQGAGGGGQGGEAAKAKKKRKKRNKNKNKATATASGTNGDSKEQEEKKNEGPLD